MVIYNNMKRFCGSAAIPGTRERNGLVNAQPVQAPPNVLAQLTDAFETFADLEALAASLDVAPPDEREGWRIIYRWGPEGEDEGLHWRHPADEPSYPND